MCPGLHFCKVLKQLSLAVFGSQSKECGNDTCKPKDHSFACYCQRMQHISPTKQGGQSKAWSMRSQEHVWIIQMPMKRGTTPMIPMKLTDTKGTRPYKENQNERRRRHKEANYQVDETHETNAAGGWEVAQLVIKSTKSKKLLGQIQWKQ